MINIGLINHIAETHFHIRHRIIQSLKFPLNPQVKHLFHNSETYYDYWVKIFSDKFFDMGTFIRLGSALERILKEYYMENKGYRNLLDLKKDSKYKKGIFQRIQDWQKNGLIQLFNEGLNYDITTNSNLKLMQELMLHRHLYAHNTGLIDDEYIRDLKKLTGVDLMQSPNISKYYPCEDVYYFEPLLKLNEFIEGTRNFFSDFPNQRN